MKANKIFRYFLLMLLPMLAACNEEQITFDIELPRFELREGYQLLEVIVPQNTNPTDKIYIIGDFNGGMDAVGDPRWELEKATDTDAKFGIYLNPAYFIDGKTLANGYTFYNKEQGVERSLDNDTVIHYENPQIGQRENVIVYRWADYFNTPANPDEITHDGYVIYVVDNSGYEELAMYAWGDAEAFGSWPGITPAGSVTIDGIDYKYFDTGVDNEGMNLNLIFNNNNNGSQLADYNVTLNQDYYLELTPDGVVPFDPTSSVTHDGYAVYVYDTSGWDELYLYMWGDTNDLVGGWPGMPVTGAQVINGVTYKYFDLGAANCNQGLTEHVILNNNNGTQVDDVVVFDLSHDVYLSFNGKTATEIDPATFVPEPGEPGGDEPGDEPGDTPSDEYQYKIYIQNNTGWDAFYVYAWGDKEIFGGWPGAEASATEKINGVEYYVFPVPGGGLTENLIFNNNAPDVADDDKVQYDAATITLDQSYIFVAGPEGTTMKTLKRRK